MASGDNRRSQYTELATAVSEVSIATIQSGKYILPFSLAVDLETFMIHRDLAYLISKETCDMITKQVCLVSGFVVRLLGSFSMLELLCPQSILRGVSCASWHIFIHFGVSLHTQAGSFSSQ